jgi:hypothetical protein
MSVTWASDTEFALHVKTMGGWTKGLYSTGQSKTDGMLKVKIDGFYGKDAWSTLCSKTALVLWAGSVGLTYCYSLALKASQEGRPVFLRWVVRGESEFQAFRSLLEDLQRLYPTTFNCKIWWTMSGAKSGYLFKSTSSPFSKVPFPANMGRGFHSLLFPRYFHAIVSSATILVGLQGYAIARQAVSSLDEAGEPDGYVYARFIDFFYVTLFAFIFIVVVIGIYLAMYSLLWTKRVMPADPTKDAAAGEPTDQDVVIAEGSRPDIDAEFKEIEALLPKIGSREVGVAACGPVAMVTQVHDRCRASLFDVESSDFAIDVDEWEW